MNDENGPLGQDETSLKKALEVDRDAGLKRLLCRTERLTIEVTAQEYNNLVDLVGVTEVRGLLESFVADVTDSARQVWPQCRLEAHSWFEAYRYGQYVIESLREKDAEEEGGD